MHIAEKYSSLARDAMASGDSVAAENYLQHAEHYNRIILAAQAQNPAMPGMDQQGGMNGGNRFNQADHFNRDFDGDADDGEGDDFDPPVPQQRHFQERQPYNPNQPQPFIPQNAFPHVQQPLQPAAPVQNGSVPCGAENFTPGEGGGPRRRRRRPMGDQSGNKGFNGRHAGPGGPSGNGTAPGGDPAPDEASS
jgi:Domain of unknown function (DUF4167)